MERREKEAVRYLGFGKNAVDDRTLALIRGNRLKTWTGKPVRSQSTVFLIWNRRRKTGS